MKREIVLLLDEDPGLAEGLGGERLAAARREVAAVALSIDRGTWRPPRWPRQASMWPGLLLLDGILLMRLGLDGRYGGELLSAGDLLRPWQDGEPASTLPSRSAWFASGRARVAVLDLRFQERVAAYPEITGALFGRAMARARSLASSMAIVQQPKVERRVLLTLWKLADRFGTVRPDGIRLELRISHTTLAELVAARRPTVSVALARLQRSGALTLLPERRWLLHQPPPLTEAAAERPKPSLAIDGTMARAPRVAAAQLTPGSLGPPAVA